MCHMFSFLSDAGDRKETGQRKAQGIRSFFGERCSVKERQATSRSVLVFFLEPVFGGDRL